MYDVMGIWRDRAVRAGLALAMLLAGAGAAGAAEEGGAAQPGAPQGSGLPVPRFVSLKADQVNLRSGPGKDYPTTWVYRRAGLPIEVIKEFDIWREVRDADGTQGWIIQSLLSGRRTALVLPWEVKKGGEPVQAAIRRAENAKSPTVAMVEAGVLANILSCNGRWCRISVDSYRGYIEQKKLWGVYDGEAVK